MKSEQKENQDYAKYRADEVQKLFHGLGARKHAAAIACIVEMELKNVMEMCEKCAEKDKRITELERLLANMAESADESLRLAARLENELVRMQAKEIKIMMRARSFEKFNKSDVATIAHISNSRIIYFLLAPKS